MSVMFCDWFLVLAINQLDVMLLEVRSVSLWLDCCVTAGSFSVAGFMIEQWSDHFYIVVYKVDL